MDFSVIGPAVVLGLSCIGAAIGCGIAGMASHGVMSRTEEGHGKYIGMSAIPSSQAIYGFILMVLMNDSIQTGSITPLSGLGIGLSIGLTIMLSAIYQGMCAATGIQATAKQPSVFGKCLAALAIVESFAVFGLVFSLLLL